MVEQVPMPEAIQLTVAAFVAEHHVEQPFVKRKRDPRRSRGAGAARDRIRRRSRMSEPENFLNRWSRRKRAPAAEAAPPKEVAPEMPVESGTRCATANRQRRRPPQVPVPDI
ncbi:MAG: DUF3305 domain-containing protein [Pseudolabrys sp.]